MVYSREERLFILEHYFVSKQFAVAREAFGNTYPDKEVPNITTPTGNKTSGHRKCLWQEICPMSSSVDRWDAPLQHDGATAYTANTSALLQEFFGERNVGCGLWPPRSPDLNPPTFFLWGFLKGVYLNNPRRLDEMKHNTEQTDANSDPETLRKATRNTLKWVDVCLREGGGYIQHLM
jgi:hypothetical protein